MRRYYLFALAFAALLASCVKEPMSSGGSPQAPDYEQQDENSYTKGWVRIRLTDDSAPLRAGVFTRGSSDSGDPELDALAAKYGATEIRRVFGTDERFTERHRKYGLHLWFDVQFDESIAVSRAQSDFGSLPGVAHAQPIYKIAPTDNSEYLTPSSVVAPAARRGAFNQREMPFDDPGLPLQWHYDNDGSLPLSVAGADIGAFEAWENFTAGDPSVIVAVVDTGVEFSHEDLAANMWVNELERDGIAGVDDDRNGVVDDIYGCNFSSGRAQGEIVPGSHGTHVSGTIAAVNNNSIGVCGVAGGTGQGDGVRIMSTQVYFEDGSGSATPDAFRYAADNGAIISQNSWNYTSATIDTPPDWSVAFDYFIENAGIGANGEQTGPMKGGVIIFSAGNDYAAHVGSPSRDERVLSVTAMLPNYAKASYSNFGDEADLFAPGGAGTGDDGMSDEYKVYSTNVGNSYSYKNGTSMACPHVSGIAALIVSHYGVGNPGFTPDQLKEILLKAYRNVDVYQKNANVAAGLGAGLADASMMGLSDPQTAPAKPGNVRVTAVPKEERKLHVFIEVPADGNNMPVAMFKISYMAEGASEWSDILLPNRLSIGKEIEYIVGNLQHETNYLFRVASADRFGNESDSFTEASGRTIPHANLSPEMLQPFKSIMLPQGVGENRFKTTVDLTQYVTDPDLPNDALTFTVSSSNVAIVTAIVQGESMLVITGLDKGATHISVTATDRAGATISRNMAVNVTEKPGEIITPPTPDDKEELPAGVIRLSNPVSDLLTIQIGGAEPGSAGLKLYDSGARLLLTSSVSFAKKPETTSMIGTTNVSALGSGTYTAIVELHGVRYKSTFIKR